MSNNKQSSVEWLISQIAEDQMIKAKSLNEWTKIFEQAVAMHKEEIIDFAMKFMMQDRPIISFYNETFGGNNEPTE